MKIQKRLKPLLINLAKCIQSRLKRAKKMSLSSNFSSKSIKTQLKAQTNEFLANKNSAESLSSIIEQFKECLVKKSPIITYLLCLETIFVDLLKNRDMFIAVVPLKSQDNSNENQYKQWLRQQYADAFDSIVECFECEKSAENQQALITSMRLLAFEGQYPIEDNPIHNNSTFPILSLNKIISKLLLSEKLKKHLIVRLSEYTIYEDFCYYVWKLLQKNLTPTKMNAPNAIFIQNYLEMLNVLIKAPSAPVNETNNEELPEIVDKFLCKPIKLDDIAMRRNVNKIWNFIVQWPHNDTTHRQLLVLLLEKILVHLEKPTLLTDYLMDSLDIGGPVSLLALQGIFILIHKYNMSYPNIYEKLYGMFEPEIFHMKFKPRLFYLADIFLTSTYLPETLVAAFIKRLARLSLVAPPQDIIIILYFIGNLIIRHPGLKRLIYHQSCGGSEISNDPFVMDECDPNKSMALESSLWEIQLLKNHMLPNISHAAKSIISTPLPNMEWNLANYLELKENDLFDQEISLKTKEYALTFERPMQMAEKINSVAREQNKMNKYWKLF